MSYPGCSGQGSEVMHRGSLGFVLLKLGGRINRRQFCLKGVLPLIPVNLFPFIFYSEVGALLHPMSRTTDFTRLGVAAYLLVAVVYMTVEVFSKRLHDMGGGAWWCLLLLVPFGNLVLLLAAGLAQGESEPNAHGLAPE